MRRLPLLLLILVGLLGGQTHAVELIRVDMVAPSVGWGIGAVPGHYGLYRTTDGGRHWDDVSPPAFAQIARYEGNPDLEDAVGCAMTDGRRAWVCAAKDRGTQGYQIHIWRTTDGGRRWREASFPVGDAGESFHLQFLDRRHGVLLALGSPGAGMMAKEFYRTGDGGRTWRRGTSPDHQGWSFYPSGLTFRTPQEGWIAASYHGGPYAPLLHTTDGGRSWPNQSLKMPTDGDSVYSNTFPPQFFGLRRRDGLFIADLRNAKVGPSVYGTRDGGRHWRRGGRLPTGLDPMSGSGALGISFADLQHGWAADKSHRLFRTRDGGETWRRIQRRIGPTPPTGEEAGEWTQLDFVSPRSGWALFRRRTGSAFLNDLYRTDDGGHHWQHVQASSLPNTGRLQRKKRVTFTRRK